MSTPNFRPHFLSHGGSIEGLLEKESQCSSGMKIAASLGLVKVAENHYVCPSTKDLWRVDGNKIIRISRSDEVDNGESMQSADPSAPDVFLAKILEELDF